MAYRRLPGQADSPQDKPERVEPVPEHYKGVNFPYRGIELHGVEVPEDARYDTRQFQYPEEKPPVYMEPEPEPDPVLVKVVHDTARELLDWRPVRYLVTSTGQQILGRNDKRTSVRIYNHSETDTVYIGHDAGVQTYTGYPIPAGHELYPFISTEDVWAITESGAEVNVSLLIEFTVEL